jgi:signal transduction histidine kinase
MVVDAGLDRLYQRWGSRYFGLITCAEVVAALVLAPAATVCFSIYVPMTGGKFALVTVIAAGHMLVTLAAAAQGRRARLRLVREWLARGRPVESASDVVSATQRAPISSVGHGLIAGIIGVPVAAALIAVVLGLDVPEGTLVAFGGLTVGTLTAVTSFVVLDLAMGPVRREVSRLSGQRRSDGALDRLLYDAYQRLGHRYLSAVGGLLVLVALYLAPLATGLLILYVHMSAGKFLLVTALLGSAELLDVGAALARVRPAATAITGARRSPRSREAAVEAWRATIRAPAEVATRYFMTSLPLSAALGVAVGAGLLDLSASGVAGLAILGSGAAVGASVACGLIVQLAARPVLSELAARLPPNFAAPKATARLASRAFVGIVATAMTSAGLAVVFAGRRGSLGDIGSTVVVLVLCVVPIGLVMLRLIIDSVTRPVRDLLDASARVAAGDLEHSVRLSSEDELGVLASSFNQMLSGLRERETLRKRIVTAADAERRRVERDLHDGAQQRLVLVSLKLSALEQRLDGDAGAAAVVAEIRDDVAGALAELRDLAHGIYPSVLASDGLAAALSDAVTRAGIPATCEASVGRRYAGELEAAIYFCCLEALQNAAKYAGPEAKAVVRLAERDGELMFQVSDDGVGYDPEGASPGAGLQNMADRIGAVGGSLQITSAPGAGTTVTATVPARAYASA